ncbi:MAG: fliD [Enterobacter mori]|nr:fliD [Enterobacter mori]
MKAWVDAYNTLQDSFASLTKYTAVDAGTDAQDSSNGALLGDSTLRTIQTQLKTMLSMKKALTDNPTAVKDLVVGDGKTTGITTTMATQLTDWLSSKGIIQAAKDGVSKTLNKLTDQYNAVSERIDARVAQYKAQFTQLDVLMTSLNNTSSYLTQQFENTSSSK